tara:strand:- start:6469 stop:7995 length:1527 start_codon:yes stop_codon:yes gene_type:complete
MALVLHDRVKETTTSTGTGTINLAGAATGFTTFVAGIGNSNTTYYCIAHQSASEFEVGIGTVTDASPDTITGRTNANVFASSNSNNMVDFSAGTKDVFCTQPASKAVFLDSSGNLVINGVSYGNAIANRFVFTASADQSAFTGNDDNGATLSFGSFAQVYLNGSLLKLTTDYAVSSGNTVTLQGVTASVNDILEVIDFNNFNAANTLIPTNNLSDVTSASTARTNLGLGDAATKTVGIASGNVPTFAASVVDNDFLKIDGTTIEGRDASQVLSDIAAAPLASPNFTGDIDIDNIKIDGNTISSTDTNGNINLTPNGTGKILASTTPFFSNFLGSFTISSVSALSTGALFSDTYDIYDIYLQNMLPVNDDVLLILRLEDTSGGQLSASNYSYYIGYVGSHAPDGVQSDTRYDATGTSWTISGQDEFSVGNESDEGFSGLVRLYNTRNNFPVLGRLFPNYMSVDGYFCSSYFDVLGSTYTTTTAGGARIFFSSGYISSGVVSVYGLKSGA